MTTFRSVDILGALKLNGAKLRGLGVRRIGLFGSAARDQHTSGSDLDFVVEVEDKNFDAYMDLKFYLGFAQHHQAAPEKPHPR